MLVIALVAGGLIGVTMGALGGGGSILTVPVLVYALDLGTRVATTASLVIVGVSSVLAALPHAQAQHVRWRTALPFGAIGVAVSFGGAAVGRLVSPRVLLSSFAALVLVVAILLLLRTRRTTGAGSTGAVEAAGTGRGTLALLVVVAAAVGFLTGFLGVGGGFLVVPALVLGLRCGMSTAVGTSLVVIAITSLGALAGRWGDVDVPWGIVVPFTVAAVLGSLLGARWARRASDRLLTRAFAGVLVLVGTYVAVRAGSS